jgi:ubiquinone/menaquinone biosynthesis C-methylase UbiE
MHALLHGSHRNLPGLFQGRSSRVYDVVARRVLRRAYRRVAEDVCAAAPQGAALLDVGTGPGVLLMEIAQRRTDLKLTGVDLSPDMVSAAERNLRPFAGRATARVGDVTDLPFPDRSFDMVVSSISLHHWDRPEAAVPELARVLRPGGRLFIYDFGFAPFDTLVDTARTESLFTGAPPQRTPWRTGVIHVPRAARLVMSTAPE